MDDNMEEEVITVAILYLIIDKHLYGRLPMYDSARRGSDFVDEVVNHENPSRCRFLFRMNPWMFQRLCRTLRQYGLSNSRGVLLSEKVGIFLVVVGQGLSTRMVQEMFQHSGETISRHFKEVLQVLLLFAADIIRPEDEEFREIPQHIRDSAKYYPFFKDCIGAIDGTHVGAHVPSSERIAYTNRKGQVSQNILAVCDFNYRFTFIGAGGDGQSHDANLLREISSDPTKNFPLPPPSKYYLVDSGFANKTGFLAPYRGERYHGSEFRQGGPPRTSKELFNHVHASLRNVIERTFGMWKNRFRILHNMPTYKIGKQVKIVVATAALHNYILMNDANDPYNGGTNNTEENTASGSRTNPDVAGSSGGENVIDDLWMTGVRDVIAGELVAARTRHYN